MEKWSKNVKRDLRNDKAWRKAGWNVIVVWECARVGAKAEERTLARICAQIAAFAEARKSVLARPRRLEFPKSTVR